MFFLTLFDAKGAGHTVASSAILCCKDAPPGSSYGGVVVLVDGTQIRMKQTREELFGALQAVAHQWEAQMETTREQARHMARSKRAGQLVAVPGMGRVLKGES